MEATSRRCTAPRIKARDCCTSGEISVAQRNVGVVSAVTEPRLGTGPTRRGLEGQADTRASQGLGFNGSSGKS
eukprot:1195548-Prorocentrum_minimum.AAC.1